MQTWDDGWNDYVMARNAGNPREQRMPTPASSYQAAGNMQAMDDGWNDHVMARNACNPREQQMSTSESSNQAAGNMQAWDDGWNDYVMARNAGTPREQRMSTSASSNQAADNMQAWDNIWNDYVMARNPGYPREAHSFEPWCQPLTDDEVMRIMQGGAEQHPSLALINFNCMMMRRMAAVEEKIAELDARVRRFEEQP